MTTAKIDTGTKWHSKVTFCLGIFFSLESKAVEYIEETENNTESCYDSKDPDNKSKNAKKPKW